MRVPKGAEVLLETRFPYLNADQRRWILYSTGLPSGYVFLDDAEGWGRLNLYDCLLYTSYCICKNIFLGNLKEGPFSLFDSALFLYGQRTI